MPNREPSLAELADDFTELRDELREFIRGWPRQLEDLRKTFVNKELYETRHSFVQERISKVELKDSTQDEAIKRVEDEISEKFSKIWSAIVSVFVAPIVVALVLFFLLKGQ
jgi:hypothetical protein